VPVKNFHKNLSSHDLLQAKKKGHCRELSEVSLQSNASDDSNNQSETEKLVRKISELSDILEQREYKLVEIGRENAELHEQNMEMLSQLEAKQKQSDSLEVSNVTEEYTHRLSALEKKFQQSIRERDGLRKQLNVLKNELTAKINKSEADKIIADKEFMVEELRIEGEKLSKQVLQHTTIIKKLRAKEKDSDATIKRHKENIEELSEETERLKKSLTAKEDVERSQIGIRI
jgi:TATA element modulatory factor